MASKANQPPTVEQQLTAARAPAGSALEQLIRDHQDVSMLPADEYDPMGLPHWLKVWWRTEHPEIDESNGLVAYPLIIEQMWEFMRDHPDNPTGTQRPRGPVRRPRARKQG